MTFTIDPATVLVAVLSSAVLIFTTWYFSRRHYTQESRSRPLSQYDVETQGLKYVFWIGVIICGGFVLFVIIAVAGTIFKTPG